MSHPPPPTAAALEMAGANCRICDSAKAVGGEGPDRAGAGQVPGNGRKVPRRPFEERTHHADLEAFPPEDLEVLHRYAVDEAHAAGTVLFRQAQRPEALFIVEEGQVDLLYEIEAKPLIVETVGAGSVVGDLPALLGTPYPYTAAARTATSGLRIDIEALRKLDEARPDVCFRWLRLSSRRLERAYRRVVELSGRSAFERLALLLSHEAEHEGSGTIHRTQAELAAILGLSRQTVSRALRDLERQGLVERGHGHVRILKADGVRRYLGVCHLLRPDDPRR